MNDMSSVIVPKSDQWNADSFISGPQTFTIRDVQIKGGQEQPVSIYMEGSDLAFRPCKSMSRVLVSAWGPDAKVYIGRSLTLYRDPSVKWGGLEVGGIRISHMSHIDGKMQLQLTATKGQRKPHIVMPLIAAVHQHQGGGLTIEEARDKMSAAFDLEELRTIWTNKAMAPHRAALAGYLDECKAALSSLAVQEGPADEQRGEAFTVDADWIIAKIEKLARVSDVNALVESHLDTIKAMAEEDQDRVVAAQLARNDAIKGAGE